ncbi:hypothetical protein WJX73_004244 [Symbiochloris irregularis]|uniref:ADP-ribosylation factor-related protein 1 n=1 Tax=Symbiochloris irregularis TaxID=706552 RepID=A0AAW1NY81_9CHLO
MFSLLYGFWEYIFRKEELRVLMLGLDKAGKTNLLERLKTLYTDTPGLESDKVLPTVGLNVGRLDVNKAELLLWDLGGQPGLRSIWDKYYADSHGVIFVVDCTTPARLDEAKHALDGALGSRELFGAPLLVMANKQDVEGHVPASEITQSLGLGIIDGRPCRVQPISAHNGNGIREAMRWLVDEIGASDRKLMLRNRAGAQ